MQTLCSFPIFFKHEAKLKIFETDAAARGAFLTECGTIKGRLEELCNAGIISEYTKCMIMDMSYKVAEHLARNYERVREGVKEIMVGRVLDYEAKRIRNEGIDKGRSLGLTEGKKPGITETLVGLVRDGVISPEEAAKRMEKTVEEFRLLL